ncbi:Hypothetical protein SMAX5B_002442 [Scophthalmus maximus]|uniref:Uncharacterized protein n=1 Tax=Scophthalmus maximus TaxID=52904 RepID=A0A2U9AVL6_SCOMX|nr:Hypothetical protein SMAX5B_002442 [Scophthalmus maximus]
MEQVFTFKHMEQVFTFKHMEQVFTFKHMEQASNLVCATARCRDDVAKTW